MLTSFLAAATLARAAVFTLPVGLFFAAAAAPPSEARAALATASALTIGSGLGLWPSGRLLDRIGPWRGLRLAMLVGSGSLLLLAAAMAQGWPLPGVLVVAALSGAAWSAVISVPRALLPDVVHPARLPWASGIEAACVEVSLILAPVAGALLGRWGPVYVPAAAAVLLSLAALLLPGHSRARARVGAGQPLVSRRILKLAGLALLLGLSGGLMEPGLAALSSPPFGGLGGNAILFVTIGLGSAAGGLLAAHLSWPHTTGHGVPLLLVHAAALAGVAVTSGPAQLALLMLAGLPIAPLQSLGGLHLDRWAGPARAGETFALVTTALTLGAGLGQAVAAQAGGRTEPRQLILAAAVPPVLAALLVAVRRLRSSGTT